MSYLLYEAIGALAPDTYLFEEFATTEEFWTADGVVLNTGASFLQTLEGREGVAQKRGDNVAVGIRHGRKYVPKRWEQRSLFLALTINGAWPDGSLPNDAIEQFRLNLELVKMIFGKDGLIELTRRVKVPAQFYGEAIQRRTTWAETVGDLQPVMRGPASAIIPIEMVMPDPFWYSDEQALTLYPASTVYGPTFPLTFPVYFGGDGQTGEAKVQVNGNVSLAKATYSFVGPLTDPSIEHRGLDKTMSFTTTLSLGETLVVDTAERTVKVNGANAYSVLDQDSEWFDLVPLDNPLKFRAASGAGRLEIAWRDAWH